MNFADLHYPVEIRDDGDKNTLPLDAFNTAQETKAFIHGYTWGTIAFPNTPVLRVIEVKTIYGEQYPKDGAIQREYVIEIREPLVLRPATEADEAARQKRIAERFRMVPR